MTATTVRKWSLRLGLPIALLGALLVAGPFLDIHFVAEEAPEALTLPAVAGAATFADWGIANPSVPGDSVQSTGTIEFLLSFTQV